MTGKGKQGASMIDAIKKLFRRRPDSFEAHIAGILKDAGVRVVSKDSDEWKQYVAARSHIINPKAAGLSMSTTANHKKQGADP